MDGGRPAAYTTTSRLMKGLVREGWWAVEFVIEELKVKLVYFGMS